MQGRSVKKKIPFVRQGKLISFWIRSLSKKSIEYLKMGRVDFLVLPISALYRRRLSCVSALALYHIFF